MMIKDFLGCKMQSCLSWKVTKTAKICSRSVELGIVHSTDLEERTIHIWIQMFHRSHLSSRPGRRSAGSMRSGREEAARTHTPSRPSTCDNKNIDCWSKVKILPHRVVSAIGWLLCRWHRWNPDPSSGPKIRTRRRKRGMDEQPELFQTAHELWLHLRRCTLTF